MICQYKDECKFHQIDNCAFRHVETKKKVIGEGLDNQIKIWTEEIENLTVEIVNLIKKTVPGPSLHNLSCACYK